MKRVLNVPEPLRHGAYYWDTEGVPEGPIVITVDLVAQTLSIFRAGYEIGTAAVIYGADEKPTPLGVFKITQKDAHHVSNLYGAPMPYMLRLTNDGISIHGSALMEGKYATHGCVGVPTAFAKLIFGQVKLGDQVIVTSGEMLSRGGRITAAQGQNCVVLRGEAQDWQELVDAGHLAAGGGGGGRRHRRAGHLRADLPL